jgi:hypothetical protein
VHFCKVWQLAAVRYFTIFFLIHTKTYYTHNSEKVNKKLGKFFVIMPLSWYHFRFSLPFRNFPW